jgi:phospholipid-binding lipoprotein MlaA
MKARLTGLRRGTVAAALAVAVALGGCASVSGPANDSEAQRRADVDPLEGMNRAIFDFNQSLDDVLLRPVARGYVAVVPELFRWMISNAFANLADLRIALNQLLQGKPLLAGSDLLRFGVNTVFCFGGIADLASELGLERHNEDFGQTMGRWGIGSGPYLVLPLFGPSTVRDGLGLVVDIETSPLIAINRRTTSTGLLALWIVDARANLLDASQLLEGAALDKYLFLRDGYLQRRRNLIWDGDPPEEGEAPR